MTSHDVFISYATEDKQIADAVCAAVEARGVRCWIAPRDVVPGTPYGEAIVDAIQAARMMVVIFSSHANASVHIPKEVELATSDGVTIIPFRVEDVLPAKSLNYFLASLHWLDAFVPPLDAHLLQLGDVIANTLKLGTHEQIPKAAIKYANASAPQSPPIIQGAAKYKSSPDVTPENSKEVGRPRWQGKPAIGIAAVVLLAVLAGAGWYYRSRMTGGEAIDSLAVLPLVNGSGDPNMEYLSDGITESLINSLSQLPKLEVKSRDSAFHYKGKNPDAETVGREMGVRAVLKGRVTQIGDNLAISAELIDARNNDHIWGQQYSRKTTDIFVLQADIAKEISAALRTRLTGEDQERVAKTYTANPEAYQLYLTGLYFENKSTEDGFKRGIDYFQQAIAKDANYALAYAGQAHCYSSIAAAGFVPPKETFPKAKESAQKALELDDTVAQAHTELGYIKAVYDWDWHGGEMEFQRSIQLNPNYADAHRLYGIVLRRMGRLKEAMAENKRAVELDPFSPIINRALGLAYYESGQYDQAIEQEQKTLALDPNFLPALDTLGQAYLQKSMDKEGMAEFERIMAISPGNPLGLSSLGYAYAVTGRQAEALKMLDQLDELSRHRYVPVAYMAWLCSSLGKKDKAFEWLEKGSVDRFVGASPIRDPRFDPLRSDPRWAALLRRMNLTP